MRHAFNEFNWDVILKKKWRMPSHAPSTGVTVVEGRKCDVEETATDITPANPNWHCLDDQWLQIFGNKEKAVKSGEFIYDCSNRNRTIGIRWEKKAVWTDGRPAEHHKWENAQTIFFTTAPWLPPPLSSFPTAASAAADDTATLSPATAVPWRCLATAATLPPLPILRCRQASAAAAATKLPATLSRYRAATKLLPPPRLPLFS
jgi:hypothetical protein